MVLLLVASLSVPTWNAVSFLNVGVGQSQLRYGVFGFTGSDTSIGYHFANEEINTTILHNLTKTLILHPIACGLAGLAFLFGLCGIGGHRFGTILMTVFSALAAIVTLVIFVIDMVLFGIARSRYRDEDVPAQYGNANWMVLGALVALIIGFCASACGVFGRYRRRRGDTIRA
jgi:hypothetical protein